MHPLRLTSPVALMLLPVAGPARGGMVNLAYAGSDPDDSYVTSSGPGSFSFASGKSTLGLGDLTAFQFSFTVTSADPSLTFSGTFTYNLSDLVNFSATLSDAGPAYRIPARRRG